MQGSMEGYDVYAGYMTNVLAGVTGDPALLGHESMRAMLFA
jgi:hypothetical protein